MAFRIFEGVQVEAMFVEETRMIAGGVTVWVLLTFSIYFSSADCNLSHILQALSSSQANSFVIETLYMILCYSTISSLLIEIRKQNLCYRTI